MKFYSYRDPNTDQTVDTFKAAVEWLAAGNFTERDIDEALLYLFSNVDSPVAPSRRGVHEYITTITYEEQEAHRKAMLGTTKEQIIEVVKRLLVPKLDQLSLTIVAKDEGKEKEPMTKEGWVVEAAGR